MASITGAAEKFFEACETGEGWEVCKAYCKADATFSAQAEPLADIQSLREYTEWMKGLLTFMPDGRYELKAFATDEHRQIVCAYGIFSGTHTGEGGPCPPTGKSVQSDYVYVMEFDGDKIRHMTKIWHSGVTIPRQSRGLSIVSRSKRHERGLRPVGGEFAIVSRVQAVLESCF